MTYIIRGGRRLNKGVASAPHSFSIFLKQLVQNLFICPEPCICYTKCPILSRALGPPLYIMPSKLYPTWRISLRLKSVGWRKSTKTIWIFYYKNKYTKRYLMRNNKINKKKARLSLAVGSVENKKEMVGHWKQNICTPRSLFFWVLHCIKDSGPTSIIYYKGPISAFYDGS